MNKYLKVFTDFDGTIAINDVGDTLFETFAKHGWQQPIIDWQNGFISSKECFIRLCDLTTVTKKQLEYFSDSQLIDPHFKTFVNYCDLNMFPLTVLSDGLDFYINRIFKNYGLDNLVVHSNKLIFVNGNQIKPEFPYYGKGCPNCANCKGYHIKKNRQNGDVIVYIGDGLSDRCGVLQSDIVFAKDDLKNYCIENKVSYYDFNNFNDILNKMKEIHQ